MKGGQCLRSTHKHALLVQSRDVDRTRPDIPQRRRRRPKHRPIALEQSFYHVRRHRRDERGRRQRCTFVVRPRACVLVRREPRGVRQRRERHGPTGCGRPGLVRRDVDQGGEVRVAGDDERTIVVVGDVVSEKGNGDAV